MSTTALAHSAQIKERPILFNAPMVLAIMEGRKTQTRRIIKPQPKGVERFTSGDVDEAWGAGFIDVRCPFGQPGDRLWVRETWARAGEVSDVVDYRADNPDPVSARWRPSIHMPRWASRITLEITGVHIEQLERISDADALAEGFDSREAFSMFWEPKVWNANPWVWGVEFKRISEPTNAQ